MVESGSLPQLLSQQKKNSSNNQDVAGHPKLFHFRKQNYFLQLVTEVLAPWAARHMAADHSTWHGTARNAEYLVVLPGAPKTPKNDAITGLS